MHLKWNALQRHVQTAIALLVPLTPAMSAAIPCEDLVNLQLPDATITSAELNTSGEFDPPPPAPPITGLPPFCRVVGVAEPTDTSMIGFEVWMPTETWNNKFEGVGSGGSLGSIGYTALADGLNRGYSTMANDNGHTGSTWTFAQFPEKVIDFGYRAQHVTTQLGKLVSEAFYEAVPAHSYFVGCSQGGHHALMELQRYPEDYDGIVGGDPANYWTHLMTAELFNSLQASLGDPAMVIPPEKLQVITQAVISECDAKDGLVDGLIVDPRRCTFDPSSLLCPGEEEPTCLTAAQVDTVRQIYVGPRNPRTGEQIFLGEPNSSEAVSWQGLWVGVTLPGGSSYEFFVHGVYGDNPNFDYHTFDFDADLAYTDSKPVAGETYASALNAINPDISAFRARGGKLIMYHGFSDGFITPYNSIGYYNDVVATLGRGTMPLEEVQDFARLFMVPEMGHCAGGPGATTFDALEALEQWVEDGIAPERIIAAHLNPDRTVAFTRPLCPYPQEARYRGRGSIDDAANFVCRFVELRPLPLVDSFAGDEIDPTLWSVQATEGTAAEGGGTLTLSPNPLTGTSTLSVFSNSLYDFTGGQATVQVNEVVGFGGVDNLFSIQLNSDNALAWRYENGMLLGIYYVGGARTVVAALPYSTSEDALWRIREYNGVVLWETSPDGSSWITQGTASTARLFSLQSVNVLLAANTFGEGSPDPGQARYSNLNVQ